ncbi:MAG: hypothetical protein ABI306_00875 [Caulobacteraceae bacterium]
MIIATASHAALYLYHDSVFNAGLLAGTGEAGLIIASTTVTNTGGGIIAAGSDCLVRLLGADIVGGTLTSSGSGQITTSRGKALVKSGVNILDGTTSILTNRAKVVIADNTALTIEGSIVNADKILVGGETHLTNLIVGVAGVTLSGGGAVNLGENTLNRLYGATGATTLTNFDNTLSGAGLLGNGQLTLDNQTKGVIDATGTTVLNIDTGASRIVNAGTIEATGAGGLAIAGEIYNAGETLARNANVTIGGNVSGAGKEIIYGSATLAIGSSFGGGASQAVSFAAGATGTFKIDQAEHFAGTLRGLATGRTLDLGDINFATASLTFSGSANRGVLVVTDGTTTANITLIGAYAQANFALADDSGGHTDVTYNGTGMAAVTPPAAAASIVPSHQFIAAMAALGADNAAAVHATAHTFHTAAMLLAPRTQIA